MALAKEQLILCLFFFFETGGRLKVLIFFKPLSQLLFHLSQKMTSWYAISYSACLSKCLWSYRYVFNDIFYKTMSEYRCCSETIADVHNCWYLCKILNRGCLWLLALMFSNCWQAAGSVLGGCLPLSLGKFDSSFSGLLQIRIVVINFWM